MYEIHDVLKQRKREKSKYFRNFSISSKEFCLFSFTKYQKQRAADIYCGLEGRKSYPSPLSSSYSFPFSFFLFFLVLAFLFVMLLLLPFTFVLLFFSLRPSLFLTSPFPFPPAALRLSSPHRPWPCFLPSFLFSAFSSSSPSFFYSPPPLSSFSSSFISSSSLSPFSPNSFLPSFSSSSTFLSSLLHPIAFSLHFSLI